MIFTVAQRELKALFLSPLAWVVLALVQFIVAYLFLIHLDQYLLIQPQLATLDNPPGVSEYLIARLFLPASSIYLMVMPLLTMRLISEELQSGSFALLLSAPISMTEIVLGKYVALMSLLSLMLLLTALMPLSLLMAVPVDLAALALAVLGCWLLLAAFAAIGLYFSSLTAQPLLAAVGAFALLLFLWLINATGQSEGAELLDYLALSAHLRGFLSGVLQSVDLIYYLLLVVAFLGLAIRRLDNMRLND
ncbi:MAG: ABC transporter permease subunit [Gammaproteobacteria bacterium]|nr:ABC transporter permease subunit [Gammaproteobacteria bacterium]